MFKKGMAGVLSAVLIGLPPYEACARSLTAPVRVAGATLTGTLHPLVTPGLTSTLSTLDSTLAPGLTGTLPVLTPITLVPSQNLKIVAPSAVRAANINVSPAVRSVRIAAKAQTPKPLAKLLAQQNSIAETAQSLADMPAGNASAAGIAIMDKILGEQSFNSADSPRNEGYGLQTFDSEGNLSDKHPSQLVPASADSPRKKERRPPTPQGMDAISKVLPTTAAGQWGAALFTGGLAAGAYFGSSHLATMALTGILAHAPVAALVAAGIFAASAISYLGLGVRVMLARSGTIEAGDHSPMKRPYAFFQKGGFRSILFTPVDSENAPYMPSYAKWTLTLHARVRKKAGKILGYTVQTIVNVRYLVGESIAFGRSLLGLFPLIKSMYRGDKEVKPFVKQYRKSVWTLQGINVVQAVMGVATSYVVGALIDAATENTMGTAVMFAGAMVAMMLANAVLNTTYGWIKGRLTSNVLTSFRENLFGHLLRLPFGFFGKEKPSQVAARMSVDVANLATKNIGIPVILPYYGAMALFAGIMITLTSWQTTLLVTLVGIPLSLVAHIYGNKAERLNEAQVNRRAEMISAGEETLSRARDIRAFATEDLETNRYIGSVDAFIGTLMRKTRISSIYTGGMDQLYHAAFYLSVLFIGLFSFIATGEPTIGQTMAMVGYAGYMRQALAGSLSLYTQYRETTGSSRRVLDYLKEKPAVNEAPDAVDPGVLKGGVSFSGVDFSYDGKYKVLQDINFDVAPGQHVALVGGEGSGKSALLDLIARLDDPTVGGVSFDGKAATTLKLAALRRQLSLLHDNGIWLDDQTVRDNLTYGLKDEVSDEEILEAARKGGADFLENTGTFPDGLDTILNEGNWRFTAFRKKQLEISRAILADPRIVLLDRPVSGLNDFEAARIEAQLRKLTAGRTSFSIGQRIEDARSADVIFVIKKGTIVERGRHDELMAAEGVYYNLWISEKAKEAAEK
ncbi:MAG: hypothetical protein COB53_01810 [Elusimicrobia bacterium]|nr:MAG: hypothetical protein COB53_01810 [Elusimicrobiota bacterium]